MGHGCNTPCLQVTDEASGETIIFDAGSGIVGLSQHLTGPARELPVVLTHYHWDHLQGLPFLAQLYAPGWQPHIVAPAFDQRAPEWVDMIFRSPFFPVPYEHLPNRPHIELIGPGQFRIGVFELSAIALNHPGGSFAYRVRAQGSRDLVYATDHEFGDPTFDEPLADLARDAGALVLDAHFTPDEIPNFRGWGHSDWRQCAQFAADANVGSAWLFHHKPGRSDSELAHIIAAARNVFEQTQAASEGATIEL